MDLVVAVHLITKLQVIPSARTALVTRILSGSPEKDGVWSIEVPSDALPASFRLERPEGSSESWSWARNAIE